MAPLALAGEGPAGRREDPVVPAGRRAAPDARIADYVRSAEGRVGGGRPTRRREADLSRLLGYVSRWLSGDSPRDKPLVYLHGGPGSGAEGLVAEAARGLGLPVLTVEMEALGASRLDLSEALFLLFREGLLSQAALFLRNADRALEQNPGGARYRALIRFATEMGGILFVSGQGPWRWPLPPTPLVLRSLDLRAEGFIEQLEIWQGLIEPGQIGERELERLVSRHPLPFGGIADA